MERQFGSHCPGCGKLLGLAPVATSHCEAAHCPWMVHACGTVFDTDGHHMPERRA
jgi:hypothetical protein